MMWFLRKNLFWAKGLTQTCGIDKFIPLVNMQHDIKKVVPPKKKISFPLNLKNLFLMIKYTLSKSQEKNSCLWGWIWSCNFNYFVTASLQALNALITRLVDVGRLFTSLCAWAVIPKLSDFLRRNVPSSWCSKVCENRRHTNGYVETFRKSLMRKRLVQVE